MEVNDEVERTTTDLLVQHRNLAVYAWRGTEMRGPECVPSTAPEGGDSAHFGTFGMRLLSDRFDAPDADAALYVEIPGTAWGDYVGATWTRSNARVMLDRYREHIVAVTGDFSFETLMVPLGAEISTWMFDDIVHLIDSPILDEDDWSQLESEIEQEDWDSWGRDQWRDAIRDQAHAEHHDDDVSELDATDYADALFWDTARRIDVLWQAETAVSGYWTDFDRAAELAWAEIQERRMAELEAWARELAAPIPGQLCLL
jgi:hypothetical protein